MFRLLLGLLGLISVQAKDYVILYATDPISSLLHNRSNAEAICDEYKLVAYNCTSVEAIVYFNGETFSDVTIPINTAVMTAQGDSFLTRWNRTSVIAADFYSYFGGVRFWTGIGSNGTPLASHSCFNWKSNSTLAKGGVGWQRAYSFSSPCDQLHSILCGCYSTSSTLRPTLEPTALPTAAPTKTPSKAPSTSPSRTPSKSPTTSSPSRSPSTTTPSMAPTYPIPLFYTHYPADKTREFSNVTSIASGNGFTCVIVAFRDTYCWGRNDFNQAPAFIGGEDFTTYLYLTAGPYHACRARRFAELQCWGRLPGRNPAVPSSHVYQTAPGETVGFSVPLLRSSQGDIVKIDASEGATCLLDSLGQITCWGYCPDDMCGSNTASSDYNVPWKLNYQDVNRRDMVLVDMAVADTYVCAIRCMTRDLSTGLKLPMNSVPPCEYHNLFCKGAYHIEDDYLLTFYVVSMTAGRTFVCIKRAFHDSAYAGSAGVCFGSDNTLWQHGSPDATWNNAVTMQGGSTFPISGIMDAGANHVCRVNHLGARQGGRISCWGANTDGQLGKGYNILRAVADVIIPVAGYTEKHNIHSLALGETHSCVVFDIGRVRCWGSNTYGELGDGTRTATNKMTPIITTAFLTANEASSQLSLRYFPIPNSFNLGIAPNFEIMQRYCMISAAGLRGVFRVFPFAAPDNYTLYDIVDKDTLRVYNTMGTYINYFSNVLKGILPVAINPNRTALSFFRTNMNTVGAATGGCHWGKSRVSGTTLTGAVFSDFNAASSPALTIINVKCNLYPQYMCMVQHYSNAFTPEGNF